MRLAQGRTAASASILGRRIRTLRRAGRHFLPVEWQDALALSDPPDRRRLPHHRLPLVCQLVENRRLGEALGLLPALARPPEQLTASLQHGVPADTNGDAPVPCLPT